MMPVIGANLEREERMFLSKVGADDEYSLSVVQIRRRGQGAGIAAQRLEQGRDVARAMMIDVPGTQPQAGEFLQIKILFVGGARGSDHSELAATGFDFGELPGYGGQRLRQGHRLQSPSS